MKTKIFNTFSISVKAKKIISVYSEIELLQSWQKASAKDPVLFLGSGSNTLFLENYQGTIILNRIKGFHVKENNFFWNIHVCSGELWHNIVTICVNKGISGLENLSWIPGYTGAAPIQNIGAYGVEFKQVCSYVDFIFLETGEKVRLSSQECNFGYRKSIFNSSKKFFNYAIVAIGLKLKKKWKACLNYTDLSFLEKEYVSPKKIYNKIFYIRKEKIPNPVYFGNAGSFFKNPLISSKQAKKILKNYPKAPCFKQLNGNVKFSAGWIIEACGLKGYKLGKAAVYHKQASIIINTGSATGYEIAYLAKYIFCIVKKNFSIQLEPEVKFISKIGEIKASKIIS
ncbi:murB [Wigglesworthia glossinidia endosymbiont of Glossina brevipalpis]|uniref:UDP-N-acetylenolpyruvoylglucosamine reductase n=1 Tax=Wigglesworthia glossinidia brevipalpis TaxID=36870 RepID=MURB_WIGBR|nr:RecName: Full=UDP-N-acetylenolpyruvoylglucosamine reductase; AltName: Full=UDP-N-acetylmuramate dehydrogenase [Wigglesworthia glossinidia endosymbiont of Glossina brevipalpis]BAC24658.1 murB [Wigglesworthia glossinidia endosymbiont of Glossina brevipalpis]